MQGYDCHAHAFGLSRISAAARYRPQQAAPLAAWRDCLAGSGLAGGVLVQPSFLGTDNSQLLQLLEGLDRRRFRAVAVASEGVGEAELERWRAAGIAGLRWNLVEGAPLPDLSAPATRAFLGRLRRLGLHLEIHLEGPPLAGFLPPLAACGLRLVVDHFGLPREADPQRDAGTRTLCALAADADLFVKFSAPYRSPVPIGPHAAALLAAFGSERIVWGSDWPWTRYQDRHAYPDTLAWLEQWVPAAADRRRIAAETPARLYGLGAEAAASAP